MLLEAGHSVFLNGELGAGKTTLAKGLFTGLGKKLGIKKPLFLGKQGLNAQRFVN